MTDTPHPARARHARQLTHRTQQLEAIRFLRQLVRDDTEIDTRARAAMRAELTIVLFYNDEPTEPDQAIRDMLSDLVHLARHRGLDFQSLIPPAVDMAETEHLEWLQRESETSA